MVLFLLSCILMIYLISLCYSSNKIVTQMLFSPMYFLWDRKHFQRHSFLHRNSSFCEVCWKEAYYHTGNIYHLCGVHNSSHPCILAIVVCQVPQQTNNKKNVANNKNLGSVSEKVKIWVFDILWMGHLQTYLCVCLHQTDWPNWVAIPRWKEQFDPKISGSICFTGIGKRYPMIFF